MLQLEVPVAEVVANSGENARLAKGFLIYPEPYSRQERRKRLITVNRLLSSVYAT